MRLPTVVTVLIAICGALVFYSSRKLIAQGLFWNPESTFAISLIALVGAFAFVRVGYRELPKVYRILTRTTALGIVAYLLWERPDFTLANAEQARLAAYVEWGYWVALAAAVLSLWRPSLLYAAALYVIASRYLVDEISGFGLSTLDIRYMVEMAQFLALGACGIASLRAAQERWGARAHALGGSAWLAWWDVVDIKIPMVQAQVQHGEWVDVPVSYFLSHSYAVSHGYIDMASTQGHYAPTISGSVQNSYQRFQTSGTCPESTRLEDVESEPARTRRLARVERFIRTHHRKIMARVDENGRYGFYLRSHHHPSNPWMYESFNSLDLREIRRYRLLTQSVCLSIQDGQLVERVIKVDSVTFEIDD